MKIFKTNQMNSLILREMRDKAVDIIGTAIGLIILIYFYS
jgi:hypothetical protein